MALYRAEVLINAPPGQVRAVLVDLHRYPEWNPFTVAVSSTLQVGSPVKMKVRLNGRVRSQRETVRAGEPERVFAWGMRLGPRWLLRGERWQRLDSVSGGTTRYITEDRIQGWLAPVVQALFGTSLEAGFAAMATALKNQVEACARRR